jgi:hypothetical protein
MELIDVVARFLPCLSGSSTAGADTKGEIGRIGAEDRGPVSEDEEGMKQQKQGQSIG